MRRSREEQIIGILKERRGCQPQSSAASTGSAARRVAVQVRGMQVSDARKLKGLEDENRRLKKLLAESMLDVATCASYLQKTSNAQIAEEGRGLGDDGD